MHNVSGNVQIAVFAGALGLLGVVFAIAGFPDTGGVAILLSIVTLIALLASIATNRHSRR